MIHQEYYAKYGRWINEPAVRWVDTSKSRFVLCIRASEIFRRVILMTNDS